VDGFRISHAESSGATIRETCPKIVELDLSRNLFEKFDEVVRICAELDNLRSLRLK
jgi:tubulin-specific chaperone E